MELSSVATKKEPYYTQTGAFMVVIFKNNSEGLGRKAYGEFPFKVDENGVQTNYDEVMDRCLSARLALNAFEPMREALEGMIIGACAIAVTNAGERAALQLAVDQARKILASLEGSAT